MLTPNFFRPQINFNLNENPKILMAKFSKFDIKYTRPFVAIKKEKNRKILKEQSKMNRSLLLKSYYLQGWNGTMK